MADTANTIAFIGMSTPLTDDPQLSIAHHGNVDALSLTLPSLNDPSLTLSTTGLGVMGYPMAVNLRNGIDAKTKLLICDVSEDALTRFQKETEGAVEVVKNGYEAVQQAVSLSLSHPRPPALLCIYRYTTTLPMARTRRTRIY